MRRYTKGVARIEWVPDPGVRNEPLDCRVYATAALQGLYAAGMSLSEMAERVAEAERAGSDAPRDTGKVHKIPAVVRSNWLG